MPMVRCIQRATERLVASLIIAYAPSVERMSRRVGRGCALQQTSLCPRQDLLQLREELLPSHLGAATGLLLIRPEARLLHAQVSPRARWREREGHDTFQIVSRIVVLEVPSVGQRFVRLDGEDFAVQ